MTGQSSFGHRKSVVGLTVRQKYTCVAMRVTNFPTYFILIKVLNVSKGMFTTYHQHVHQVSKYITLKHCVHPVNTVYHVQRACDDNKKCMDLFWSVKLIVQPYQNNSIDQTSNDVGTCLLYACVIKLDNVQLILNDFNVIDIPYIYVCVCVCVRACGVRACVRENII